MWELSQSLVTRTQVRFQTRDVVLQSVRACVCPVTQNLLAIPIADRYKVANGPLAPRGAWGLRHHGVWLRWGLLWGGDTQYSRRTKTDTRTAMATTSSRFARQESERQCGLADTWWAYAPYSREQATCRKDTERNFLSRNRVGRRQREGSNISMKFHNRS